MDITKPERVQIPEGVLTDSDALALLERIFSGDRPEGEFGIWILQLERATGCPHIQNIIKHRKEHDTPADVIRRAREYRPIQL